MIKLLEAADSTHVGVLRSANAIPLFPVRSVLINTQSLAEIGYDQQAVLQSCHHAMSRDRLAILEFFEAFRSMLITRQSHGAVPKACC